MLLEKLLEREAISHNTLRQLDKCYNLSNGNAEVRQLFLALFSFNSSMEAVSRIQRPILTTLTVFLCSL